MVFLKGQCNVVAGGKQKSGHCLLPFFFSFPYSLCSIAFPVGKAFCFLEKGVEIDVKRKKPAGTNGLFY